MRDLDDVREAGLDLVRAVAGGAAQGGSAVAERDPERRDYFLEVRLVRLRGAWGRDWGNRRIDGDGGGGGCGGRHTFHLRCQHWGRHRLRLLGSRLGGSVEVLEAWLGVAAAREVAPVRLDVALG